MILDIAGVISGDGHRKTSQSNKAESESQRALGHDFRRYSDMWHMKLYVQLRVAEHAHEKASGIELKRSYLVA